MGATIGIEDNKNVVQEFLANAAARNKQVLSNLLADDVRWWILGQGFCEKRHYLEEMDHLNNIWDEPMTFKVSGITAEGDRVAVEVEYQSDFRDGRHYHQYNHFLFVVRDGKIREWKMYFDTKYAVENFGSEMPEIFRE